MPRCSSSRTAAATLYTDFRYIESARTVEGVEPVLTKRALMRDIAERLPKARCSSRPTSCRTRSGRRSPRARASSCRRAASSRSCGRSRTTRRSRSSQRACRIADRGLEALTAETWVGRSEREIAWRLRELLHAHGADELSFDSDRRLRPERRACRTRIRPTGSSTAARSSRSTGASASTATAATARARSRPAALPDRLREAYDVCLEAQKRACANIKAGMTGVEADAARARRRSRTPASARTSATGSATASASPCTRRRASRPSRRDTLEAGHRVTIEPGIYLRRASAACGSRTSRSSATTASTC